MPLLSPTRSVLCDQVMENITRNHIIMLKVYGLVGHVTSCPGLLGLDTAVPESRCLVEDPQASSFAETHTLPSAFTPSPSTRHTVLWLRGVLQCPRGYLNSSCSAVLGGRVHHHLLICSAVSFVLVTFYFEGKHTLFCHSSAVSGGCGGKSVAAICARKSWAEEMQCPLTGAGHGSGRLGAATCLLPS